VELNVSKSEHLKQTDVSLITNVKAHLKRLEAVSTFNVDEADLAVASASLRFLLVDDWLVRAWKASGFRGPITLRRWCITAIKGDDAVAYCGGGDLLPGQSACHNAEIAERSLNLRDFCHRPCIQVGSTKVSTVQLIQYVSNTRGGTHFDPEGVSKKSQKPAFNLLRQLEAGELGGPPIVVNSRNLLHHELLSIAQAVLRSPQVAQLRAWHRQSRDAGPLT
jgi:hypothetical protein